MAQQILNYEVIRKIGEGGMGQVFLARNKSIHQFVAIKMLHPQYGANPALRERFRQEAIMLSSLDHPNIVKLLNYVENEQGIFLIMEYVDGMTLEDFIMKKSGLIVEERAFPMMMQILDAFAYAHKHGIVHRDIKPSNVFIAKDGNIKVLDFGIAQILSDTKDKNSIATGSLAYMSPEQARNHPVDIRSDIYSLGVVFYQMLTGREPYDLNSLTPIAVKKLIVEQPLPRMKEAYPYISDFMQSVVDKATQKDPARRFPSCIEMKQAVIRANASVARQNAGDNGGAGVPPLRQAKKNGSKGAVIGIFSALAVIVAGVLGFWVYDRNRVKSYSSYTDRNGIAVGIISSGDDSKPHYEIDYSNGRPVSMRYVGPAENIDSIYAAYRPVKAEYEYDGSDLKSKKIFDSDGKLLYTVNYSDRLNELHIDRAVAGTTVSAITDFRVMRDSETGRVNEIKYLDADKKQLSEPSLIAGSKFSYDSKGRLVRVTFVDADGRTKARPDGVAIIAFEYGDGGKVDSRFYNEGGTLVTPVVSANAPVKSQNKSAGKKKKAPPRKSSGKKYYNPAVYEDSVAY